MNIGDMLAGANTGVGKVGDFVMKNQVPLMKAADLFNIIGGYHTDHGRGFEIMKKLNAAKGGGLAAKGIADQGEQQNPPLKKQTTTVEYQDLNKNGVPDAQEGAQAPVAPVANAAPQTRLDKYDANLLNALITGGGSLPFQQDAGGNAGTPAPVAQAPVVNAAPVQEEVQPPSAQNLNIGEMEDLGWMLGSQVPIDVAKTVMANRLKNTEHQITREGHAATRMGNEAALMNARAKEREVAIKEAAFPSELRKTMAETSHLDAQTQEAIVKADDTRMKTIGALAYSPEFQAQVEMGKKEAELRIKAQELTEYLATPQSKLPIPPAIHKAAGLAPGIKTFGDAAKQFGSVKDAMNALTDAHVKERVANINATGVVDAGVLGPLNAIRDIQIKDRDKALAMVLKLSEGIRIALMDDKQKAANEIEVNYWKSEADSAAKRLAGTEATLQNIIAKKEPGPTGLRNKGKEAESVTIRVGGKEMKATKVSETQARGSDGKLYNIKPSK